MANFTSPEFPQSNLPVEAQDWRRSVERALIELLRAFSRGDTSELATNKMQNSTIKSLGENVADLDQKVQDAFDNLVVSISQITPGTFPLGFILPAAYLSGTVINNVDAPIVNAELYGDNITFNITTGRVAIWGRTADGLLATATSSEKNKTEIRPVDWDDEKIEAIVAMELVYYRWKANIQARADALDPEHPLHGMFIPNPLEVGFIAERMHEAGLWEFVVYERNPDDSLVLDENGEAIPVAIHYTNWALALHEVVRRLWSMRKRDRRDLDRALTALGLDPLAE